MWSLARLAQCPPRVGPLEDPGQDVPDAGHVEHEERDADHSVDHREQLPQHRRRGDVPVSCNQPDNF